MNENGRAGPTEAAVSEAIDWVIRLRGAAADDWASFTHWLETDPSHAEAYDKVTAVDVQLDGLPRSRPSPVVAPSAPRRRRPAWLAGLAAATTLGVTAVVGVQILNSPGSSYEVATAAGEHRSIRLPDGSRIDMNGATVVILDRSNPRFARLEAGEALFTVVHDQQRPFEVFAGDTLLRDLGTVFNVTRDGGDLDVSVAEGAVHVRAEDSAVTLQPGMAVTATADRFSLRRVDPGSVGGWVDRRLTCASEPIGQVAEALSRGLGVKVEASPDVRNRPFTGVVLIEGDNDQVIGRVAAMASLKARRSGNAWLLVEDDGAS